MNKTILKLDDIHTKAFENTKVALTNEAALYFENQKKPRCVGNLVSEMEGEQKKMILLALKSRSKLYSYSNRN